MPFGGTLVWAGQELQVDRDTWRHIGWLARSPQTGELTRYPAEVFGPIPELDGDVPGRCRRARRGGADLGP